MINIPYLDIQLYLMEKLNKVDANFTEQELRTIDELFLNPIGISHNYNKIDFNLLKYFTGLKRLEIYNSNVTMDVINILVKLPNLESVYFSNCYIESIQGFYQTHLKSFGINKCIVHDLENIASLKALNTIKLINMKLNDIKFLENLPHLTEVDLSYSSLVDTSTLYHFILIERLSIDNSTIEDLDFVNKYSGLTEISISHNQYLKNKSLIDDLVALDITVYEDDVICYNNLGGGSFE